MDARQWRRRFLRRGAREAHRTAKALGAAGRRLAERLAYRPREVVVIALLTAGLFGGLVVERWRARHPATADRLEAEPARLTIPAPARPAARLRPRSVAVRCEDPSPGARRLGRTGTVPARPRVDLNRATPGELAHVAGISWRLAARIVAAREAFEGRGSRRILPDGAGPPSVDTPPAPNTRDADPPEGTADAESP
jgi:hypothetical protein